MIVGVISLIFGILLARFVANVLDSYLRKSIVQMREQLQAALTLLNLKGASARQMFWAIGSAY